MLLQGEQGRLEEQVAAVGDEHDLERRQRRDHRRTRGRRRAGRAAADRRLARGQVGDQSGAGGVELAQDLALALARPELHGLAPDHEAVGLDLEYGARGAVAEVVDLGQDLDALAVAGVAARGEGDQREVVGRTPGAGDLARERGGVGAVGRDRSRDAGGESLAGGVVEGAVGEDEDPPAGLPGQGGAGEREGAAEIGLTGAGSDGVEGARAAARLSRPSGPGTSTSAPAAMTSARSVGPRPAISARARRRRTSRRVTPGSPAAGPATLAERSMTIATVCGSRSQLSGRGSPSAGTAARAGPAATAS